jgi:hypothetical protein
VACHTAPRRNASARDSAARRKNWLGSSTKGDESVNCGSNGRALDSGDDGTARGHNNCDVTTTFNDGSATFDAYIWQL